MAVLYFRGENGEPVPVEVTSPLPVELSGEINVGAITIGTANQGTAGAEAWPTADADAQTKLDSAITLLTSILAALAAGIPVNDDAASLTVDGDVGITGTPTVSDTTAHGKLDTANTSLSAIDTKLGNGVAVEPGTDPLVIGGGAAHDAAFSGNPIMAGGVARTARPTAVGNGDAVLPYYLTTGEQVVWLGSQLDPANDAVRVQSGKTIARQAVNLTLASGDNTLKAAGTNKIKVISIMFIPSADVNIIFKSGAGTALTGAIPLLANQPFSISPPANIDCYPFETASATALLINASGAADIDGWMLYADEA